MRFNRIAQVSLSALSVSFALLLSAQTPNLQQRAAEVKESVAANKMALAQYTWQEQQTISIKGQMKKQQMFQVHLGPGGQPEKVLLGPPPEQKEPSGGPLRRHIVEKKTEEYKDYAQQLAALAHSYAQPEPGRFQQAFEQGNVMIGSAGAPGEVKLVIHNYVKPNDTVTMVFNSAEKAIQSLQISSYLEEPKDAVEISAQFARLPDGTNHVTTMLVDGVSKQLTMHIQNLNYEKSLGVPGQMPPG